MLDFRIIVAAIIVCVSLVMIGTRVLSTSDAFNIAAGSRPGIRTMSDPVRPSIALSTTSPAAAELPAPPQTSIAVRSAGPATPVMPAAAAKPQSPNRSRCREFTGKRYHRINTDPVGAG